MSRPFSIVEWLVLSFLIVCAIAAAGGGFSLLFYVYGVPVSFLTAGVVGLLLALVGLAGVLAKRFPDKW